MRRYGIYGVNPDHCSPYYYDVADCQDLLPKGARIRNKKHRRRIHNKKARQAGVSEMNKGILEINKGDIDEC